MFAFGAPASRGHAAARGLVATVLGAACLVWPGVTIGAAVVLFAIYCIADAGVEIFRLFGVGNFTSQRIRALLLTALDVAAALIAIVYPGITAGALVIVIGVWAILSGGTELTAAWGLDSRGSGWLSLGGIISIVAGLTLIVWPGIGAVTLAIVFGAYLVAYGLTSLISAAMGIRQSSLAV